MNSLGVEHEVQGNRDQPEQAESSCFVGLSLYHMLLSEENNLQGRGSKLKPMYSRNCSIPYLGTLDDSVSRVIANAHGYLQYLDKHFLQDLPWTAP